MSRDLPDVVQQTAEVLARGMFAAYNEQGPNPWKTFDGRDVPGWGALNDQVRAKWLAAAQYAMEAASHVTPAFLELEDIRAQKDNAYAERNKVLVLLASMAMRLGCRVGVGQHDHADTAWEFDWRTILFIDLPSGQASWHFHDSETHLLDGLPRYPDTWDGHSTPEKYERVLAAAEKYVEDEESGP